MEVLFVHRGVRELRDGAPEVGSQKLALTTTETIFVVADVC